jgi:hypothetical protein
VTRTWYPLAPLILACVLAVVAVAKGEYVQALGSVVIGALFTGGYIRILARLLRKAGTGRDLHDAWAFARRYGKPYLSAREQTEAYRLVTSATGDELSLAREDRRWRREAALRSAGYAKFVAVVLAICVGTLLTVGVVSMAHVASGRVKLIDAVAPIVIGAAFVAACLLIEHSRAVRFAMVQRVAAALGGTALRGVGAATKRLDWLDAASWGDTDAEFAGHPWDTLLVAEGYCGVRVMLVMTRATKSRARRTDVYLAAPGSWHPDTSNFLGEAGWSFRAELGGARLTRNDLSIDAIDPERLVPLIRRVLSSWTQEREHPSGGPP